MNNKKKKNKTTNVTKDNTKFGVINYNMNYKITKSIKINRNGIKKVNHKNTILPFYLIFIFLSLCTSKELNLWRILATDSQIILTIRGSEMQPILYEGFSDLPSEIYINGIKQNTISNKYSLSG